MFTRARKTARIRATIVGLITVAATVVAGGRGVQADNAVLTDPDDTSSSLDVLSGSISNTTSKITYLLTLANFNTTDVERILLEFDFGGDGVRDKCVVINQSGSAASGLAGVMTTCEGGGASEGSATVTKPAGNQLSVLLDIQTLRDAGLGSGNSYGFRVRTADTNGVAINVFDDQAPNETTAFVNHVLGLVCGSTVTKNVTLTANITGCERDGLILGKSGKKLPDGKIKYLTINLSGFRIEAQPPAFSNIPRAGAGVRAGTLKYVKVIGGTIEGFLRGIDFVGTSNSAIQNMTLGGATTADANTTGIRIAPAGSAGGSGNQVKTATVTNNSETGLVFTGNKTKVSGGTFSDNGLDGISHPSGTGGSIKGATASSNGDNASATLNGDGIDIDSTAVSVGSNTANDNDGNGITAPDVAGVKVPKNSKGKFLYNNATGNAGTQCDPARLCPP
jgi:hypothetical protein